MKIQLDMRLYFSAVFVDRLDEVSVVAAVSHDHLQEVQRAQSLAALDERRDMNILYFLSERHQVATVSVEILSRYSHFLSLPVGL